MPDAEVFVGLTIRGEFDPDAITRNLGLTPARQVRQGEVGARSRRVASISVWSLDSGPTIEADTIEPHLEWLLDLIEPRADALAAVVAEGAMASADCSWTSVGMSGGPWITPESMGRLSALNLPLVVSFYASEALGEV